MEISTEIEQETTVEFEGCNETLQEELRADTIPRPAKQIEMQYEKNMADEQSEVQEETVVTKLNLKQQIDVKKWILEESKQYINIDERRKIMNSSMEQQMIKIQESIHLLKEKIKDEKIVQRRAEIEMNEENRKLLEIKNFTESTKEIVDVLRSYVEGFEQQIKKLKFAELQKKVLNKYEESIKMKNEKTSEFERMKGEISNVKHEYNVAKEKLRNEMESKETNMKNEEVGLRKKLVALQEKNLQLRDEISKIDEGLTNKQGDELKNCTKMKEFFNLKMDEVEKFKLNNLRIKELECKRISSLKSIEFSSSTIASLTKDIEQLVQENSTLEAQLKVTEKDIGNTSEDDIMDEMQVAEMEKEKQNLMGDLQNIEEKLVERQKYHDELVMSNHEKEISLLKKQNASTCLRQDLIAYQRSNDEENKKIQKLKEEKKVVEEEVERKQKTIETLEKELISQGETNEHLQISLEKYQQEIKDKNDQLSYQRNTLQVHLEEKLKHLENKLDDINKRNNEEKEKFIKMEEVNKKRNEQYHRLRNVYLTLKTSSSEFKSPEPTRKHSYKDVQQENIDKIEAEHTSAETSPRSILKSPGKERAPVNPTKNVKFVGVPSIASSNSSEMVNVQAVENADPFDEMKKNLVPRNRTFD